MLFRMLNIYTKPQLSRNYIFNVIQLPPHRQNLVVNYCESKCAIYRKQIKYWKFICKLLDLIDLHFHSFLRWPGQENLSFYTFLVGWMVKSIEVKEYWEKLPPSIEYENNNIGAMHWLVLYNCARQIERLWQPNHILAACVNTHRNSPEALMIFMRALTMMKMFIMLMMMMTVTTSPVLMMMTVMIQSHDVDDS